MKSNQSQRVTDASEDALGLKKAKTMKPRRSRRGLKDP